METVIEIEFPYVRNAGKPGQAADVLKLPVVSQMIPLKYVTDALGLDWEKQRAKVVSKVKDDQKLWSTAHIQIPTSAGLRSQMCVALRTLQTFLESLREGKSKDPELLRHFRTQLLETICAQMNKAMGGLPDDTVEDAAAHVICVNKPLEVDDKFRREMGGWASPEDIDYLVKRSKFSYGVVQEMVTMSGQKKKGVRTVTIDDVHDPVALEIFRQDKIEHGKSIITPRSLQRDFGIAIDHEYRIPGHVAHTLLDDEQGLGGTIPKDAVIATVIPEHTVLAPWMTAA